MTRWTLAAVVFAIASVTAAAQTGRPIAGTATIAGVVLDDLTNQPIRHAEVMLSTTGASLVAHVNADNAGRFRFDRVAAGRYVLSLSSPLHVRMQYGASSPEAPGRPIEVAEGARIDGIVARMIPGAVISGTIRSPTGEPMAGTGVVLWHWGYLPTTAEPSLVHSNAGTASTDDRGRYRFYPLPAGEYLVATTYPTHHGIPMGPSGQDQVQVLTHAEIEAVRRGTPAEPASRRPPAAHAITFFPGVTRATDAEVVGVAAGQERSHVDFKVQTTITASIHGVVVLPSGVKAVRTLLSLHPSGSSQPIAATFLPVRSRENGTFTVSGVLPGDYTIAAAAYLQQDPAAERLFGVVPVRVDGRDVTDVVVSVRPGATISGRVQFPGAAPAADVVDRLRVSVSWVGPEYQSLAPPIPAPIGADGRFVLGSVPPGRYVIRVRSLRTDERWAELSAIANGIDHADVPIEVSDQAVTELVVNMSGTPTRLSGSLTSVAGDVVREGSVIVFSIDPQTWRSGSRRLAVLPVGADGRFGVSGLPPGEYHVAVTDDVRRDRMFTAPFIRQLLATNPMRVTLTDGERKELPLVVRPPS